ncbi:DUF1629 domain-containing protein [Pseudohalocynthiibacter sp. F2068]|jgi:Immunity protein family (Imm11)|uniref:DUF1629 domain-containing protein n=1 Tax=Pseudohalocynthiibacter sp. F2068 TaxID=2926418 RepID=UPI001FF3EB3E|nr:DUF1629 domain-containing protein [Pseudohalocynthiibacter sp. F2068]
MTYVLHIPSEAPFVQGGDFPEFFKLVPDLHTRSVLSGVYRYGKRTLTSDEVPREVVLHKKRKSMPDCFLTTGSLALVTSKVREILEQFDPGLHQFFPIDVRFKSSTQPEGEYFAMNVTRMQDSIVDDVSSVAPFHGHVSEKMHIHHFRKNATVRKFALSGANLWREKRYPASFMMSDAFFEALKAQKIKMFRPYKAKEI